MRDSAAVADHIQALVPGLEMLVDFDFHVVELDLDAVQEGIVIGGARGDSVEGVDHLDYAVQNALGQNQREIAGLGLKSGPHEGFLDSLVVAAPAADQIAEALDYDAASEHVRKPCDAFAVAV